MAEVVAGAAHAHRGVIDSFHGDHFVISFNAARANAEGPAKAARCALDITGGGAGLVFATGVATGRAYVGNLGTATLKRLSIIHFVRAHNISSVMLGQCVPLPRPLSASN